MLQRDWESYKKAKKRTSLENETKKRSLLFSSLLENSKFYKSGGYEKFGDQIKFIQKFHRKADYSKRVVLSVSVKIKM